MYIISQTCCTTAFAADPTDNIEILYLELNEGWSGYSIQNNQQVKLIVGRLGDLLDDRRKQEKSELYSQASLL